MITQVAELSYILKSMSGGEIPVQDTSRPFIVIPDLSAERHPHSQRQLNDSELIN